MNHHLGSDESSTHGAVRALQVLVITIISGSIQTLPVFGSELASTPSAGALSPPGALSCLSWCHAQSLDLLEPPHAGLTFSKCHLLHAVSLFSPLLLIQIHPSLIPDLWLL